jgi:rod shape-determining protein MreC
MPGLFEGFFARHRRGVTLSILVLLSLFSLLISNRTLVVQPKQVGFSVVSFFQKGFTGFFRWFGDTAGSISQLRQAREELASARQRLQELDQTNREIVELRRENQLLRDQLGFIQSLPAERIAAEVIAKDHDNLFSTITVNKGSRHGVKRNMPVVAFHGDMEGLVGKVVAVGLGSSQILPLYDPQCQISARLERSRFEGLVSGQGKDRENVIMRYVKKIAKDSIEYGDLAVTAGLGGLYPKGINIGRIRDIRARSYETSLELEVEPIIDFSRLEYVFILNTEEGSGDTPAEAVDAAPAAAGAGTGQGAASGAVPGGAAHGASVGSQPGAASGVTGAGSGPAASGAAARRTGARPASAADTASAPAAAAGSPSGAAPEAASSGAAGGETGAGAADPNAGAASDDAAPTPGGN